MPAAIKMVRDEMGDNAIIIASEPAGKRAIKVTAAVEDDDEPPASFSPQPVRPPETTYDTASVGDLRFQLQNILRFHNVPDLFSTKLMQKISDKEIIAASALIRMGGREDNIKLQRIGMEKLLGNFFTFAPLPFDNLGAHLMLVGAPGIGKTFTIAKIATRLAMEKVPIAVVTTDNKRAGGVEQLKAFTNILEVDLDVIGSRKALKHYLASLPARTRVLIDTAGCNAYDQSEMKELQGFADIEGVEPVMVMAAGGDSMEAIDTAESFAALPIQRILVTRADTARRFGGILAVTAAYDLAFCNISASSSVVDALRPADAATLADLLLQYQLQT
jgi:flagellar biosynthesis protein FlhF